MVGTLQQSMKSGHGSSVTSLNKSTDSKNRSTSQGMGDADDTKSLDGENAGRRKFDQVGFTNHVRVHKP